MKYQKGDRRIRVTVAEKVSHGDPVWHSQALMRMGKPGGGKWAKWRTLKSRTIHGDSPAGRKIMKILRGEE